MPDTYNYPAEIERDEDGRIVVAFPDFGWGVTDGASRDEALAEAKGLLREIISTTIREGGDLPEPSRAGKGGHWSFRRCRWRSRRSSTTRGAGPGCRNADSPVNPATPRTRCSAC